MGPKRTDKVNSVKGSISVIAPTPSTQGEIGSYSDQHNANAILFMHLHDSIRFEVFLNKVNLSSLENQQYVGRFAQDLSLCCRETGYVIDVPVQIRPIILLPPPTMSTTDEAPSKKDAGKKLAIARAPSASQSVITQEESRSLSHGTGEKSATVYKFLHIVNDSEYFRPKLLVDSDNDLPDVITTLYMRAWQLDLKFLEILKKVVSLQDQLHTLKSLSLDGNPVGLSEQYHILIDKEESKLLHLSLRFCSITDVGAELLAKSLGNMITQNWKLLTLNLSGNRITDKGAKAFAKALRFNRTLICLNLSSNFICDKGAIAMAIVLRRIVLTSEEILYRRYLLSERYGELHSDETRVGSASPTNSTISTLSTRGKAAALREGRNDWKRLSDVKLATSRKTTKAVSVPNVLHFSLYENRAPSAKDRKKSDVGSGVTQKSTLVGRGSLKVTPNTTSKEDTKGKSKKLLAQKKIHMVKEEDEEQPLTADAVPSQLMPEKENPLFEQNEVDNINGDVWLNGNRVLLSLNLSRNYLTMNSVNEFLSTVQQQNAHTSIVGSSIHMEFTGLCRLELKGMADIQKDFPEYQSLETLLLRKNPSTRFQLHKDKERELIVQSEQMSALSTKDGVQPSRVASSIKSTSQRPTSRLRTDV
ncbi:unnamed protein product [Didymodactylos carnosus]|uniref:Leucine-rich repeat-containing protein 71 n=1 Tax=Didymodactylos carnosus TaxID=1234261 RepID=A0A814VRK0_9BILA|nr:unnamed protein product [Didymodactylos carnosus]CAF3956619.1 unnamed protein product [Didymodactylos carnosus]